MKQTLIYILFFSLLLSCTTDDNLSNINETVNLAITKGSVVGDQVNGVTISSLRFIVFDTKGAVCFKSMAEDMDVEQGNYLIPLVGGKYIIYAIANETEAMSIVLNKTLLKISDIDNMTVVTPETETDLVLVKIREVVVDAISETVSVDGSMPSIQPIKMELERVATKVSLTARKDAQVDASEIIIESIQIRNITTDSYLVSKQYDATITTPRLITMSTPIVVADANETSSTLIESLIIPELNRATERTNETKALTFIIDAKYNGRPIQYEVPILPVGENTLMRNTHYKINLLIDKGAPGVSIEILYEVANWYKAGESSVNIGEDGYISSGIWTSGTQLDSDNKTVLVRNNTTTDFDFILSEIEGKDVQASWTAHLTNNVDFEFDLSGNGVREGIAKSGISNIIKVKPKRQVSGNNITTELYITIDNGVSFLELDINGDGKLGAGNRYVIRQLAN
ncbi:MAG: hypothetical protein ACRDDZ_09680 [Marinifilaceae bacterium]